MRLRQGSSGSFYACYRASAPQPDRYMCVSGMRGKKTESRLGENSIITISEQQRRRYSEGGGGMRKIAGREATSHSVSHLGSPEDDSDELISS